MSTIVIKNHGINLMLKAHCEFKRTNRKKKLRKLNIKTEAATTNTSTEITTAAGGTTNQ